MCVNCLQSAWTGCKIESSCMQYRQVVKKDFSFHSQGSKKQREYFQSKIFRYFDIHRNCWINYLNTAMQMVQYNFFWDSDINTARRYIEIFSLYRKVRKQILSQTSLIWIHLQARSCVVANFAINVVSPCLEVRGSSGSSRLKDFLPAKNVKR